MKLIMENWKRYLSEASTDWKSLDPKNPEHYQAIFNLKAGIMDPDYAKIKRLKDTALMQDYLRRKEAKKEPSLSAGSSKRKALHQPKRGKIEQDLHDIGKERNIGSHNFRNSINSIANFGLMFADPTGQFGGFEKNAQGGQTAVSSIEIFNRSRNRYKKEPSLFNGAMIALSGLAMIPFLGGAAKAAKLSVKTSAKSSAAMKVVSDAAAVSKEINALPAGQVTKELSSIARQIDKKVHAQRAAFGAHETGSALADEPA